ncbi:MAG: phospholipase [Anaerolineae bacterium]|nr:phospholipase [Anaerolineae bacterium]
MVLTNGAPLDKAHNAVIMLHGRGASAYDILSLSTYLDQEHTAFLAPQAANSAWYPHRFIEPVEQNAPWLSSALGVVGGLVQQANAAGLPTERVFVLGFSQGACLSLEFVARHPAKYGGVFALSGALIENGDKPRDYAGSLQGTPVFLGCSDADFHIPLARVERSAEVMTTLGAAVTKRIYPNMGHSVNEDEIAFVKDALKA